MASSAGFADGQQTDVADHEDDPGNSCGADADVLVETPGQAQTYSYFDQGGNLVNTPYSGVTTMTPNRERTARDFYGGYNAGPYAGQYGFYRRLPLAADSPRRRTRGVTALSSHRRRRGDSTCGTSAASSSTGSDAAVCWRGVSEGFRRVSG